MDRLPEKSHLRSVVVVLAEVMSMEERIQISRLEREARTGGTTPFSLGGSFPI